MSNSEEIFNTKWNEYFDTLEGDLISAATVCSDAFSKMNFMIAHPQPSVATASVEGSTRIPYGWFHADYPDIPMWDGFEDLSLLLSASEWHQTFFTGVQVRLLLNLNFATSTSETISSFWNARYYAVLFPVFKQVLPSLTKATVGKGMKNQLFAFQRQLFAITTEAYRASMTGVPHVPAAELATGAGVLAAPSVVDPSTALANSVAKLLDGITQSVTNTSGSRKRGFVGDGSADGRLAGRTDTGEMVFMSAAESEQYTTSTLRKWLFGVGAWEFLLLSVHHQPKRLLPKFAPSYLMLRCQIRASRLLLILRLLSSCHLSVQALQ